MFVIYDKETTILVSGPLGGVRNYGPRQFATEQRAKAWLTRMVNKGADRNRFAIADKTTFHREIEKTETKVNLMSNKPFAQLVNTPLCCDPSSETYWSM
jgi:hypothetical protein